MSQNRVFYIVGEDPTSKLDELSDLTNKLIENEDRSLVLETFDIADADTEEARTEIIERAVASLQSPPFLTSKRIVVIRDIGACSNENVASLITYLSQQLETSYLIAVQGGGRISAQLTKAWKPYVKQLGKSREDINDVLVRMLSKYSITFEPGVREQVLAHCGQDFSQLISIIERIHGVYGPGSTLSIADVKDYFGQSGNVAIFELANEICNSNISKSLDIVNRMLNSTSAQNAKPMHPLQILALIANHFRKLAKLDDKDIRNQNDAHQALGGKGNPYGAKKSWELARRLGSGKILGCIELIGDTDVILKGANALDAQIAIELLVISLCEMCDSGGQSTSRKLIEQYQDAIVV